MKNERINVIAQAFYGNRTRTTISPLDIDRFVLGYTGNDVPVTEPIDRTIIHLPNSESIVLVYNKYQEEETLEEKARFAHEYSLKPLAVIPELDIELYSRCLVCRINATGNIESILPEDYEIWSQYLAK